MTLKTRNRLNLIFSALALSFLVFNIVFLVYQIMNGPTNSFGHKAFAFPVPSHMPLGKTFLTSYNPIIVTASLFLQMIYACGCFFILYSAFEKTQSSEVIYFSVFVFSILLDSIRFWMIIFDMAFSFSFKVTFCQNIIIFSRLLAPFALFLLALMSEPEKRQFIEQNIFIAVITALVFGFFDPINTGVFAPNFSHHYAYQRTFHMATIVLLLGSALWMYYDNKRKLISNKGTLGFIMLATGFYFVIDSSVLLLLLIGHVLLYAGSYIYLRQLHDQYLWNY